MNAYEFEHKVNDVCLLVEELLTSKSADYSMEKDVFNNLSLCEKLNITSLENGILVRLLDKLGRLSNLFSTKKKPNHESILDTVKDIICYGVLLYVYLDEKINKERKQEIL